MFGDIGRDFKLYDVEKKFNECNIIDDNSLILQIKNEWIDSEK